MAESSADAIELGLKMQTMTVEQPEENSKKEFTNPFKHFRSYTIPFSKEDLCSTFFHFLFTFGNSSDRNLRLMMVIVH